MTRFTGGKFSYCLQPLVAVSLIERYIKTRLFLRYLLINKIVLKVYCIDRLVNKGYRITRYSNDIARYKMIDHQHEESNPLNPCRYCFMSM